MVKKLEHTPTVQPERLPKISRFELFQDDSFKLNPFEYGGMTYRITGYDIEADTHSVKCIETGEFKDKPTSWLKSITNKNNLH